MTGLPPALRAALPLAVTEAKARLIGADAGEFKFTLGPTLALVAPAGMSEDDQVAWLAAAVDTLAGIPADLLQAGCAIARLRADHPSKIMKLIVDAVKPEWERRRHDLRRSLRLLAASERIGEREPEQPKCTPEEAAAIMAEFGIRSLGRAA